jgi:hypothetical protein
MREYNFIFKFRLDDSKDLVEYLDELYEAGCDDSLVGCGHEGWLAMDFTREATNMKAAVESAMEDVRKVIGNTELIEIEYNNKGIINERRRNC